MTNQNDYISDLNLPMFTEKADLIYRNGIENNIPLLRKNTALLLGMLVKLKSPESILEIGSGSGFSTYWLEWGANTKTKIITLERDKNRFLMCKELFEKYVNVSVIKEDAFKFLEKDDNLYDFVFMDSQKRDYTDLFPLIDSHTKSGSVLITDNILFGGKVLEEESKLGRYRGGVEKLKQFNKMMSDNPNWDTLFLPIDDGILIGIKK